MQCTGFNIDIILFNLSQGAKEEEGKDFKKPETMDEEKPDVKEENVGQVTDTQPQQEKQEQKQEPATEDKSDDNTKVKEVITIGKKVDLVILKMIWNRVIGRI